MDDEHRDHRAARPFPRWALEIIVCPKCRREMTLSGCTALCDQCGRQGEWRDGILRFDILDQDPSIAWYRSRGGAQFRERAKIPYTMTSLDTPVYHSYFNGIRPEKPDSIIVDLGAGDGRNTEPWLKWGYRQVIAIDPVEASLLRFQKLVSNGNPEWLERLLLVRSDARFIPIASKKAELVLAIEVLYYLNEDYEAGLAECSRILASNGKFVLSERAWEGALLTRLLYGGIRELLSLQHDRYAWDGPENCLVRTRTFTEEELVGLIKKAGLQPAEIKGIPELSLVIGRLRGEGRITTADDECLPDVIRLLEELMHTGKSRRTHIVLARADR